ncbi:MAG TPA: adenylate/guanylate cyclase domain-containing protein [Burkholderiales bacterium]|nr:adenylate/guanylate cyclase domain-containing protein [Burkholderiales bacterium]
MSGQELRHRLAAILAADVAGYSRLMAADERATVAALDAARAVFRAQIEANRGRVIDMAGDAVLAVFETAAGAVSAALAVQRALADAVQDQPEERRMRFRIGVHLGDVIEKADGTVYGDGVNIAARLESLAEHGGITVSDAVHGAVRGKVEAGFVDQGEQQVKNIAYPVRAFRVTAAGQAAPAAAPAPAEAALRPPDKPSLAVLPFANMSGDPEQEYFADGMTEDIITDVSKTPGLFVIARNSSFTYKKQHVDVKEVGRKFGVRHVLEGSVRKAGMKVRINVQLIDAETGGHVWAERFDRDLEDIFALQDEVTQKIVEALKVNLAGGEPLRQKPRGKVNSEAYDYFMRGRSCLLQFTPAALAEARAMFERALAIDPGMTQAYAWLAIAPCTEYVNGWVDAAADSLARALEMARKACAGNEDDSVARNSLGVALMWNRRLEEAERESRRAIALDPNFSEAYGSLGFIVHFAGRHEESIALFEQALRLDPQFHLWLHALGRSQFALGRYADAEATFKRRLIHMPNSDVTRAYLASLYGHTGCVEEAQRLWRELMQINPRYTPALTLRILPYKDPAPLEQFVEGLRKAGLAQ